MDLITKLKEIMYNNHLNQTQFATKIGVNPSQVSEWLSGKNKPGIDKIKAICEAFNIDANLLLGVSKKEEKE